MADLTVLKLDAGETLTIQCPSQPISMIAWCSSDNVTWSFEFFDELPAVVLDHGAITYAAGEVVVSASSGPLWISHVAAFDREITQPELASIMERFFRGDSISYGGLVPFAPDGTFGGYRVVRENLDTGEEEQLAMLESRASNGYVDREVESGALYEWRVTYLHLVEGIEWVESEPNRDQISLTLANLVLSDLEVDGLSVPIRWWERRNITKHTSSEVVQTLGVKPITFQGVLNYESYEVDFVCVDDPYGTFTAQAHFDAISAIGDPVTMTLPTGEEVVVPRNICIRTPQGKRAYGSIVSPFVREDSHGDEEIKGSFTFVENATHLREIS